METLIKNNIATIKADFVDNLFQYLITDSYKSPMNVSYSKAVMYTFN